MEVKTYHIGLWNYAKQFFSAAEKLRGYEERLSGAPVYYLYGHAIELVLKAFLVHRGRSEKELRRIGHNLVAAWEKARAEGLAGNSEKVIEASETIQLINPYYEAKELEYIVSGAKQYPDIIHMHNVAENLIYVVGEGVNIPRAQLNKWVKRDASR